MAVESQGPRFEVSIPIRYSRDGRAWGEGVVTSLSTSNLFVQTTALPEVGSRLFLAIGLGEGATYHGEARVTAHLNRDLGGVTASGFGLKFDEPPPDLTAAIARLQRDYPGAVTIDVDGGLLWPIPIDPDVANPGGERDGLHVWAGATAIGSTPLPASADAAGGGPAPSLHSYFALLTPLASAIEAAPAERLALTYRGRALAPTTGIPRTSLLAAFAWQGEAVSAPPASRGAGDDDGGAWSMDFSDLDESTGDMLAGAAAARSKGGAPALAATPAPGESDEDAAEGDDLHPIGILIAAQLRLIDTLCVAGFRFQGLTPALLDALARDEALLGRAGPGLASLTGEVKRDESLRRELEHAVEDLGAMMRRAGWHSTALESAEESQAAYEPFQVERERRARLAAARAAESSKAGHRKDAAPARKPAPRKEPAAAAERDARPGPAASAAAARGPSDEAKPATKALPPWALAAGAAATALMLVGIVWLSSGKHRDPPPERVDRFTVRAELAKVAPAVEVRDATVKDHALEIVVASEWMSRSASERQVDVEAMTLVATSLNFDTVRYLTPDGRERASYKAGVFAVEGNEHAAPGPGGEH